MPKNHDICKLNPNDAASVLRTPLIIVAFISAFALIAAVSHAGQLNQLSSHHSGHNLASHSHSTTGLASTGLWDR
jgi:hypothetical protein